MEYRSRFSSDLKKMLPRILLEAYDCVVNGKPVLERIMERYQITIDKASGITNDPDD